MRRLLPWVRYLARPLHLPYLAVLVAFLASRLVYRVKFGVKFDETPVFYFLQYVDPSLLEADLLGTILHLHHQAPLQNLLVGVALKVFEAPTAFVALDGLYLALGLGTGLGILHAIRRLGGGGALGAVAASLYVASPVTVLYESWLFYHMPVTFLLVTALLALLRYYRSGTLRAGLLFFGLLATVALTRSTYGTLWMGAVAVALAVRPPPAPARAGAERPRWLTSPRRILLGAVALPMLLVVGNAQKTKLLTGHSYGEALLWGNLAMKIYPYLPSYERKRIEREGLVSDAMKHEPFAPLSHYKKLRVPHAPTGVPLLDLEELPNGRSNSHAVEHILIANAHYKPDSLYLLKNYPDAYLRALWFGVSHWYVASPSTDMVLPRGLNYRNLRKVDGAMKDLMGRGDWDRLYALMVGLPLTFAYGTYRLLRTKAKMESERSLVGAFLYALLTIGYVTSVTTIISYGDFSRYRFDVDPLYLIVFTVMVAHAASAARSGLRRARRWRARAKEQRP